ncbi:Aerobic cobaltochelatase subunit CobN [Anaerotruncus sp. 2789STDY5834896]|uniref:Aerobic cobaltochelatase subunit CobN n=1 Tax=uncultured Anaerotruncus sp. TaxID=905011 RepID=A0A1C6K689_9FIRM|nr:Aerobic cobaltochelatase subunit CobN [uncultured Anaerotruncus sp.]
MFSVVLLCQNGEREEDFVAAAHLFTQKQPDLLYLHCFRTEDIDGDSAMCQRCQQELDTADLIIILLHGGISYFRKFNQIRPCLQDRALLFCSGVDAETDTVMRHSTLQPSERTELLRYLHAGGPQNCRNLLLWAAAHIGGLPCSYAPVEEPAYSGLFQIEQDPQDYLRILMADSRPKIGILLHYTLVQSGDLRHIQALIEQIESAGALAIPVYADMVPSETSEGLPSVLQRFFTYRGHTVPDILIVTTGFSLSVVSAPGEMRSDRHSVFATLDIPVLQAMSTYFTQQQWCDSPVGIDSMLLCSSVYQPEVDGQLITIPIACRKEISGPTGSISVFWPLTEHIQMLVQLALGFCRLRQLPMSQKKVAVILHNMPPRRDMIGCAYGLDTAQSLYLLVQDLARAGLPLERTFDSGDQIIHELAAGLTGDSGYLSSQEMQKKSAATVSKSTYCSWFSQLTEYLQEQMIAHWGPPPGTFMAVDQQLLIPGLQNGSLFIGIQPPRAPEQQASWAYHELALPCSHQYLAFYRYLTRTFSADAIIHLGTHGTVEWLPGKQVGLSPDSFPAQVIDGVPNFYPYSVDVPGEGALAKRRTAAAVISYMVPPMHKTSLSGDLARLDTLINQYETARQADRRKLPLLLEDIAQLALREGLLESLQTDTDSLCAHPDIWVPQLHRQLEDIGCVAFKDGLHVLGQSPTGRQLTDMLRLLVQVPNGSTPSLPQAICSSLDLPATQLGSPALRQQIEQIENWLFTQLDTCDFSPAAIDKILELSAAFVNQPQALERCLYLICHRLVPALRQLKCERHHLLHALDGGFIPPGPSGSPGRGGANALPTGHNFYTTDPSEIPTRTAWQVGVGLAQQLLKNHVGEEIAIVVYAGETMKTRGDDIAEILYLYGVRPIWLADTDRVIGLETIPLSELGRPRIDVTVRISGVFRDTFPNLIERVEDAVNLVAALPEDPDMNYVRKHVLADIKIWQARGESLQQAQQKAAMRIFGCPPGAYGAGTDLLLGSGDWQDTGDLAQSYLNWSGYAYGRGLSGQIARDVLSARLKSSSTAVKNDPVPESDVLDNDDFYSYFGGLVAAVSQERGSTPQTYIGDSRDPQTLTTRPLRQEIDRIVRGKILDPQWLAGLRRHGYSGAQQLSATVDILFGWGATTSQVPGWVYHRVAQCFLFDDAVRQWLESENPWALHAMSERLLEAAQRDIWEALPEDLTALQQIYLYMEGELEEDI